MRFLDVIAASLVTSLVVARGGINGVPKHFGLPRGLSSRATTSTDGSCGATGRGQSCIGRIGADGRLAECCSQFGFCGNTADYCQVSTCQASFGKCGVQPSPSPPGPIPTPTNPTSTDGSCGATGRGQSCVGRIGGDGRLAECCSQFGFCGNTADYCQASTCQAGFGKCGIQPEASPASPTAPVPASTGSTSTDGTCGASGSGQSCIGFLGAVAPLECCSRWGFCGNTAEHCEISTCQAGFGKCGDEGIAPPVNTNGTKGLVSLDGSCGGPNEFTCAGFKNLQGVDFECCSRFGFCGNSPDHCGSGCNPLFGKCPGTSPSPPGHHNSSIPVSSSSSIVTTSSSAPCSNAPAATPTPPTHY